MGLILTVTAGLVVWIVLWALGAKGFDAFMLAALIISRRGPPCKILSGYLPGRRAARPSTCRARAPGLRPVRALSAVLRCSSPAPRLLAAAAGGRVHRREHAPGDQLTIYSSLPLQGPSGRSPSRSSTERSSRWRTPGANRAVQDRLRLAGRLQPQTGEWAPGVTASDAKTCRPGHSTIAYLGDYNSAATAVSLPLINAAGILQVSPASPYVGLTSSLDAGQDEPERFYPTGQRTFGRLMPGDPVQAAAQVQLMESLGVKRVRAQRPRPVRGPTCGNPCRRCRTGRHRCAGRRREHHDGTEFSGEVRKVPRAVPRRCSSAATPRPARWSCGGSCTAPIRSCCCWARAGSLNILRRQIGSPPRAPT